MAGSIASGIKWTADKLSSLLPSATPASPLLMPSETPNTALEDLKKLVRTMERIQSVLMDARQTDVIEHCEIHRLQELKQVAYDAEDVVSDYDYDVLHAKIQARKTMLGSSMCCEQKSKHQEKVIDLSSISVAVPVSIEIASRVKKVNERFEEITSQWDILLGLRGSRDPGQHDRNISRRLETGCLVQENSVFGREEDVEKVIKSLFSADGSSREYNVRVLPIIGMGGVGKTTLAQLIYNDVRVRENFELTGWVCVSGEFDVITLTRDIITSFTRKNCDLCQFSLLQTALSAEVKGKRFFLVLDDVWNEKQILWEYLRAPLTKARSGTVLITARNSQVARIMQTVPPYNLDYLNFEDSWSLFKQLVFDYEEKCIEETLTEVARKIVRKCGGLPLAVKAIGSICRNTEYNEMKWINILENEAWDDTWNGEILPILKLSYDNLPAHLKKCYALFALFPKDHVFHEEKVIKLWISLGYINPVNGKRLEDIGRMYISELQGRSVIRQVDEDVPCFVMHDFYHDLARQVARNEMLRIEPEMTLIDDFELQREISFQFNSEARYASIISSPNCKTIVLKVIHASKPLRLLQVLGSHGINIEIPADMFLNLRHVRFLDFSHVSLTTLPESIGSLKQLHYLNLSNTGLKCLPDSICSLHKMRTLDLTDCPISEFPNCIRELVNLQHWNFSSVYLSYLPYGIGFLTNIETLTDFIVGDDNFKCHIDELKHLLRLRGALYIMRIANVTNKADVGTCLLKKHQYVEKLTLDWMSDGHVHQLDRMMMGSDELVLRSLEPNPSLVKLTIKMYGGSIFPRWVGDVSFNKLVEVNLIAFLCEFLPPLGQLPSLKFLTCNGGKIVSQVGREFFGYNAIVKGFPSLEKLDFYGMEKWEIWSGVKEGDFPNLHSFTICDCLQLVSLPSHLSSFLRTMKIAYCEKLTRIPTLPSLAYLYLGGQIHENVLVHSHFPQLKTMELSCVDNTEHLDINCNSFPVPDELKLRGCRDLKSLVGLASLASLKILSIRKCPRLCLSSEEQFPPSLKFCEISECDNVAYTKKDEGSTSH